MQLKKFKQYGLVLGLLMSAIWCCGSVVYDGYSVINVKEARVEGEPKGSSIQASINGHWLSVVFLENLGQVNIEVTTIDNNEVLIESTPTPNGVNIYIAATGSFIVTFTLPNGDEYYGEFEISD